MKIRLYISLLSTIALFLSSSSALSQNTAVESYFSYALFMSPNDGPYIETYLTINAKSVQYVPNQDSVFQGTVEVSIIFTQDDTVSKFRKYDLQSPVISDTGQQREHFLDIQRIPLDNGTYTLELYLKDQNADGELLSNRREIVVDFPKDVISMSDIEFLEGYTKTTEPNQLSKSGIDALPLVSDFFPERMSQMKFYTEIYNAPETFGDSPYLLTYSIISAENGVTLDDYVYYARQDPQEVTVLLKSIDISKLPSGNYYLNVEARTKDNELAVGRKVFFFRSNSAVTKSISSLTVEELSTVNIEKSFVDQLGGQDSLKEFALSVYPIAGNTEKDFVRRYFDQKDPEEDVMKRFLYVFWSSRNEFDPESEFVKYQQQVDHVNKLYSTSIKKGYETDRGRVYLQYGKPNTIFKRPHDPNKYPYEIWHYYDAIKRSNGRFVFYNRDMVTNDYELLHSDVYGEVNQPRWQYLLEQRTEEINDLDRERGRDYYGNQTDEFYSMPR